MQSREGHLRRTHGKSGTSTSSRPLRDSRSDLTCDTSLALNFKNVSYRTEWIDHPVIKRVRDSLGVPPVSFGSNGTPVYTLPILDDPSTGVRLGDSFDISVYLDDQYPSRTRLMPPGSKSLMAAFNAYADSVFGGPGGARILLNVHGMPFDPRTADESRKIFSDRTGKPWDELGAKGTRRADVWRILESSLKPLVKMYEREEGPWFTGEEVSYADLIVGAWLHFFQETTSKCEFELMCGWHDGFLGRIHQGLELYAVIR